MLLNIKSTTDSLTLLRTAILLLSLAVGADAIRCNVCQKKSTNEDCNVEVAECTSTEHNACYTRVERLDAYGKRYTKGCINMDNCKKLEALNDRKVCPYTPSDCYYCCDDKATCNAYNTAPSCHHWQRTAWVTAASLLTLGVATMYANMPT